MSDFVNPPPPPPPMSDAVATKPGPIGWGAVAAGVLGLLALVLPWFSPKLSGSLGGLPGIKSSPYHAWSGFVILLVGPLLLIVFGVLWLQALRGRPNGRFAGSDDPTRSMSWQSVGAGSVALVAGLLSFLLMTHAYQDWNQTAQAAKRLGVTLEKNPQPGLYALFLGAVLLIVVGVAGVILPVGGAAPIRAPEGFGNQPGGYYPPAGPPPDAPAGPPSDPPVDPPLG